MTKHDRAVLRITRKFLKDGAPEISIGQKVVSHKKIVSQLQKEFPTKKISVGR